MNTTSRPSWWRLRLGLWRRPDHDRWGQSDCGI